MRRPLRMVLALGCLLALATPSAAAQVTPEELAEARERLAELQARLDEMTFRYQEALAEEARLSSELAELEEALGRTRAELATTRELVRRRAAEMYVEGVGTGLTVLLSAESMSDLSARLGYLEEVGVADRQLVNQLEVTQRTYAEQTEAKADVAARQRRAVEELEARGSELTAALEQAASEYGALLAQYRQEEEARRRAAEEARRRAEEEEARRRAAATTSTAPATAQAPGDAAPSPPSPPTTAPAPPEPPASSGGLSCPVDGVHSFVKTWGAPRSGGRTHQGVDLMAARGTPVVAIEGGSVSLRSSSLGGMTIWLYGASGNHWYYAHLDGYAPGLSSGASLGGGELIGYVGSSGNASEFAPHLHFEQHPGGGGAVNPYPVVASACR